jgi:putative hydroxymethylpyrimidine transport system substrate-binding protein
MGQPARAGTPHSSVNRSRLRALAALTALVIVSAIAAGCGSSSDSGASAGTSTPAASTPLVHWTLVLDYEPNAVHAGLIHALRAGYFTQAGIDLKVIAPSSTSDALTMVGHHQAQLGLSDLIDVSRRIDRAGPDAATTAATPVAIAAIVQQPLSGLLVRQDSGITKPQQLAGKKIAVSGVPSDNAVISAIVRQGTTPLPVKPITLGFNGLQALKAKRVQASTAVSPRWWWRAAS